MANALRGTLLDNLGRPIADAVVRVYDAGTSNLSSIYSDKTLTTPITNDGATSPLTEADGSWGPYYVASNRYDIKYLKTGYTFDATDMADVVCEELREQATTISAAHIFTGVCVHQGNEEFTGRPYLNPGSAQAPLLLGTNALFQKVAGLLGEHLLGVRFLTSGTSYTPTTGTTRILAFLQGGGGGSGKVAASIINCTGGGGAGGFAIKYWTGIGAGPYTYAIGAAGAGGTGSPGNGGNGGNTSFTGPGPLTVTAQGGGGTLGATGGIGSAPQYNQGGVSGDGINGDLNFYGGRGDHAEYPVANFVKSGKGGDSAFGGGGESKIQIAAASSVAGQAGTLGAGGSGGANNNGSTPQDGAAGGAGFILILEFA